MLDRLLHRSVVMNIDGDSSAWAATAPGPRPHDGALAGLRPVPGPIRRWPPEHGLSSAQVPPSPQVAWGISVIDSGEFRGSAALLHRAMLKLAIETLIGLFRRSF